MICRLLGVMIVMSVASAAGWSAGPQAGVPWAEAKALVSPRPLEPRTFLVREGQPAAVIAVPDYEYDQVAARLQAVLRERTGVEVPVVKASGLVTGAAHAFKPEVAKGPRNLILLGNLATNKALARLYINWYAFEDGAYPGMGGHTVRTVLSPEGTGFNAVILGGCGPAEVQAAVDEYAWLLQGDRQALWTDYALKVTWGEGPHAPGMKERAEWAVQSLAGWQGYLLDPESEEYRKLKPQNTPTDYAFNLLDIPLTLPALHFAMSGDAALAQMAGKVMDTLYERMDWIEANRTASWDAHYSIEYWLRAWQQVANSPYLTPQQRERGYAVMGFLAGQMCMYQWDLQAYGKTSYRALTRHEWAGIFGGDALCRHVQKQCEVRGALADVLAGNRRNFGVVIDTMLQSYTDGFDHKWGLDSNWAMYQAALEEPREGFFTSGMARLSADHATMCINNMGQFANFGAENVNPIEGYDAWQILGRAELVYPGEYGVWTGFIKKTRPYKIFIMGMNYFGHWYEIGEGGRGPDTRAQRLPLNRQIHEDLLAERGRVYGGIPVVNQVPYEQTFNKLTFRDNLLHPDAMYLLLDGIGGITYSGNDAGAIIEYSRFGQALLVQIEGKPDPFYQNTVSVSRGNALDPTGTFARLEELTDAPQLRYAAIEVDPVCGARHRRHLFVEEEGCVVVIDDVTLQQNDEYAVTCNFRGLGEPALDHEQRTLTLHNEKADLRLQNVALPGMASPRYTLSDRATGISPEQLAFKVRVLRETVTGSFKAGETYRYANLFYGWKQGQAEYAAGALSDEAVLVESGGRRVVYAVPRRDTLKLGGIEAQCLAAQVSEELVTLVGLRRLAVGGKVLIERQEPITLTVQPQKGFTIVQGAARFDPLGTAVEPAWRTNTPLPADLKKGLKLPDKTVLRFDLGVVAAAVQAYMKGVKPVAVAAEAAPTALPALQTREHKTLLAGVGVVNDVALADVNADGQAEGLVACEDGRLRVVEQAGKLLLDLPAGKSPLLSSWAGMLAGKATILCGARDGGLFAFDTSGNRLWETRNTHLWYGPLPSCYSLVVADFSGEGQDQIAIGTHGGVSLCSAKGEFIKFTQVYSHAVKPLQVVRLEAKAPPVLLANTWGGGMKLIEPAAGRFTDAWFYVWGGITEQLGTFQVGEDTWLAYGGVNGTAAGRLSREAWLAGKRAAAEVWADAWYLASDGETTAVLVDDWNGDGRPELLSGNETGFLVCYDLAGKRLWKRLIGTPVRGLARCGDRLLVAGDEPALTVLDKDLKAVGAWSATPAARVKKMIVQDGAVLLWLADDRLERVEL